ncbi:MAG: hypothetical protein ACK58T_30920 [Phycisphaerae bacterium]|jgi:arsenate reductase-like glutaredoxin family protein
MSTENTQTDATSSGISAESTSAEVSQTTQDSEAPVTSFEALQKAGKEATDKTGKFSPKSVDDTVAAKTATEKGPVFTPNYKYKAALQEKEIEEFWRPLIKDADSEKRVKDFLSKIDGFDFVKNSREKAEKQLESLTQDFQSQAQVVERVEKAVQAGDLTSVFRQLGVDREAIFRWTQEQLQRMEMPPEQRKAYEDAENLRLQQSQMQEQMTQYQQMYQQQAVQARTMQLDYVLSRPEISQAANNWDSLQGQPGAFRDLVIQEAQAAYYQLGQDLSAEQAAQRVMQKFGKVITQSGAQQVPQVQDASSQTPQVIAPQARPVIPNINGKGASPIKKAPRSLDDLKRMAKEAQAAENQY